MKCLARGSFGPVKASLGATSQDRHLGCAASHSLSLKRICLPNKPHIEHRRFSDFCTLSTRSSAPVSPHLST